MKNIRRFIVAAILVACFSVTSQAQRQTTLYIDDGSGNFTTLTAPSGPSSIVFPSGGGTLLTSATQMLYGTPSPGNNLYTTGANYLFDVSYGATTTSEAGALITADATVGATVPSVSATGLTISATADATDEGSEQATGLSISTTGTNGANAYDIVGSSDNWQVDNLGDGDFSTLYAQSDYNVPQLSINSLGTGDDIDGDNWYVDNSGNFSTGDVNITGDNNPALTIFSNAAPGGLDVDGTSDFWSVYNTGDATFVTLEARKHAIGTTPALLIDNGAGNDITGNSWSVDGTGNISTGGTMTTTGALTTGATSTAGQLVIQHGDGTASDANTVTSVATTAVANTLPLTSGAIANTYAGNGTLSGGTVTISITGVTSTDIVVVSYTGTPDGTAGHIGATVATNQVLVNSDNLGDDNGVNVIVVRP
jgi:hypothetical protein